MVLNLPGRHYNDLRFQHVDELREAFCQAPFRIHGWVVLPEHLHCVIELPPGDTDFALRWRLIKSDFSKALPITERRSAVCQKRGERGIWQRRYWEHLIRDERDYAAHVDYVNINPVKHGLVQRVINWPRSTFHRLVEQGVHVADWAGGAESLLGYAD